MLNPQGRVVMISGATRGIGRAVLDRLLAAGCTVSAGVRDAARLPAHPRLSGHPYDAARAGSAEAWVAGTLQRHGRVDALVNAAGVNPRGRLLDADEAPFDTM
jgi:NAD(P)-dependent dehydrogenase (short-subunit alcohol dehydrogenase family)